MPLAGLDTLGISFEQCPGCGQETATEQPEGWGLLVMRAFHSYRCWLQSRDDSPPWLT
jgi:rRNA maturation protein Nop10